MVNIKPTAERNAKRPAFRLGGLARLRVGRRRSGISAVLVSGVFHAALFLVLALCAVSTMVGRDSVLVSMGFISGYELPEGEAVFEIEPPAEHDVEDELPVEVEVPSLEQLGVRIDLPPDRRDANPPQPNMQDAIDLENDLGDAISNPAEIAKEASTVEGAVDTVTGRIQGQLEKGDLLVVWLLDASRSLVNDRRRVADRLKPFFDDIAARRGDAAKHQLLNAVVSFGKNMRQQVEPTTAVRRVVGAVEKLPIDTSGVENVFSAIKGCLREYRKVRRGEQLMIVVWTDETGDDTQRVEEVIALCRAQRVTVCVVGPSAILGAEMGVDSYQDPVTKVVFQLPVKRGPDSALPERIDLGYWFRTRPPRVNGGMRQGTELPSWYGGRHLKGMTSGFSPHALTRLAAKTGGTYTIFDRPEDRGPFRPDVMRKYAPEYQSLKNYLKMVEAHPLRQALREALAVTLGKDLMPPETMLFVKRDELQPSRFERPYMSPAQFARKLRSSRRILQRKADRQVRVIEEALTCLGADGNPDRYLEYEFSKETSPRWRAWYDLTRGRLLATSVRLEEYRLALDEIAQAGSLKSTTNHVILLPSMQMRSGSDFKARAIEARRLLHRCVEEHSATPWAYLAERELADGLGIFIRQAALTLIPSGPTAGRASLPKL